MLVTGHTGFKGAWLTLWLRSMRAKVIGLSDDVPTSPSLFEAGAGRTQREGPAGDVRDAGAVDRAFAEHEPEVVIHMAAQSLVRRSYRDPRTTYGTNVMGTVNVLEAARGRRPSSAIVNVTSDKSYDNREHGRAFVETDPWAATTRTRARRARRRSSPRRTCGPTTCRSHRRAPGTSSAAATSPRTA